MNSTQQAWNRKQVAGELFMDIMLAFNNVSKSQLHRRMEVLGIQSDLIER